MDKYYSVEGVMSILHVKRETARKYMQQMTYVDTGGKLLVSELALMSWIAEHTKHPAAQEEATTARRPRRRVDPDDNLLMLPNGHIPTRAQERELRRLADEKRRKQA